MRKAALLIMALFCVTLFSFSQQLKPGTTIISPSGIKTMDESGEVTQPGSKTIIVRRKPVFDQDGIIDIAPMIIETPRYVRPNDNQVGFIIDGKKVIIDKKLFMDIYENNVRLNKSRFKDVNKIKIGDTVLLAPRTQNGSNQVWIANEKASGEINECLWLISAKYILGNLQTQPAIIEFTVDAEQGSWWDNLTSLEKTFFWLLMIALLLLIAGGITWLFTRKHDKALRKQAEIQKYEHDKAQAEIAAAAQLAADAEAAEKDKNPENHPPVITGGLSRNDVLALQQICQAYQLQPTGVEKLERITFVRDFGPQKVCVKMNVGAANQLGEKDLYILPGEEVCKVTMVDGKIRYFKSHCGNRFGMVVSSGEFTPPEGWREIPISKYVPVPEPKGDTSNVGSNGNGKANTLNITIEVNGKDAKVSRVE